MAESSDTLEIFRQNLVDAGCKQEIVQRCMNLAQQRRTSEIKHILACHRQTLLDTLHADEKRIDCLDYLVFTIDKEQN